MQEYQRQKHGKPKGLLHIDARETPINKVIQAIWTRLKMFGLHRANRTFSGLEILQ
jgi:hypothetical protein